MMDPYHILIIFLAGIKASRDSIYWDILGETELKLLERNIAIHNKGSVEEKSKTYHPDPTDRDQISLWEGGDVPYMFGEEYLWRTAKFFTDEEKGVIPRALKHISDNVPCIKFRYKNN